MHVGLYGMNRLYIKQINRYELIACQVDLFNLCLCYSILATLSLQYRKTKENTLIVIFVNNNIITMDCAE